MAHIEKHIPGSFSWIELATSDQNAAKTFYTSLFGWAFYDSPMGPNDMYTMFQLEGRNVAAAYTLRGDEAAMGIPPHWNLYVTVTSADDTARKAGDLGARVLAGPFDVYTFGRMAVISDPTGAVFCIWEAKDHIGAETVNEPGSMCWADLATPNPDAAVKFYTELFGWTTFPGEGGYVHLKNGEAFIGGIPPAHSAAPGAPPHWMSYVQVSDIEASTNRARDLGANICVGPMTVGSAIKLTVLADPQGAFLAICEVGAMDQAV